MLDLFLKLLEKLVALAKERQRVKKSLYDDFISPLMKQFEEVHNEYISSFQTYRELINGSAPEFNESNPVFYKLESDMIFSHSSREKLLAMSEGMKPLENRYRWSDEAKVGKFIWPIYEYVDSISDAAGDRYRNAPRGSIIRLLRAIANEEVANKGMPPSQRAERVVMEKMWEMQDLYAQIQHAFQQVKSEMLN